MPVRCYGQSQYKYRIHIGAHVLICSDRVMDGGGWSDSHTERTKTHLLITQADQTKQPNQKFGWKPYSLLMCFLILYMKIVMFQYAICFKICDVYGKIIIKIFLNNIYLKMMRLLIWLLSLLMKKIKQTRNVQAHGGMSSFFPPCVGFCCTHNKRLSALKSLL